jgi:hypothetical protein
MFVLEQVGLDISALISQYKFMLLCFFVWQVAGCVGYFFVDICIKQLAHRAKRFKLKLLIYIHMCLCVGGALLMGLVYLSMYKNLFVVVDILNWFSSTAMYLVNLVGFVLFLLYRRMLAAALAGRR